MQKHDFFGPFFVGFWLLEWVVEAIEANKWDQQVGHDHSNPARHQPCKLDGSYYGYLAFSINYLGHWNVGDFKGCLPLEWPHQPIIRPNLKCLDGFGVLRYVEIRPKTSRADQFFWISIWTGVSEPTVHWQLKNANTLLPDHLRVCLFFSVILSAAVCNLARYW